ncbi:hypothetical protein C0J52_16448 [Blattella germanica]|nr:hypothetical protein C0J52_16448 [Blattella germanica]
MKWFIKFDNAVEVQHQWRREFETEPPTRLTIKRIIEKFEMHGTICDTVFTKEDMMRSSTNRMGYHHTTTSIPG